MFSPKAAYLHAKNFHPTLLLSLQAPVYLHRNLSTREVSLQGTFEILGSLGELTCPSLYKQSQEVAYVSFDVLNTNVTSWFNGSRIEASSCSDSNRQREFNYVAIQDILEVLKRESFSLTVITMAVTRILVT